MPATILGRFKLGSATATFSTRSAIPSWRLIGSGISGADPGSGGNHMADDEVKREALKLLLESTVTVEREIERLLAQQPHPDMQATVELYDRNRHLGEAILRDESPVPADPIARRKWLEEQLCRVKRARELLLDHSSGTKQ
jgi:hypothetical protein